MPMEFDPYPDFSKVLGPATTYATPTDAELSEAEQQVSASFAHILRNDGLATYREGKLRTVLPKHMADVAPLWPLAGNAGHIFMTTCFGDFFCWSGGFCWFVSVQELYATELVDSVDWFLGSLLPNEKYLKAKLTGASRARKVLKKGELAPSQMLQWVPALAMGGSREDSSLEVVDLREGHQLLAQAGALRLVRY